jgi:hypothetical protein
MNRSMARQTFAALWSRIPGVAAVTPVVRLCAELSAIPGVATGRSRFGTGHTPAWRVCGREFAHLHSETLLDLRLPRAAQLRPRANPRAHFRAGASQWLEMESHSEHDVSEILVFAKEAAAAAGPGQVMPSRSTRSTARMRRTVQTGT